MKTMAYFFVKTLLSMLVAASFDSKLGFYIHGPGDN